MRRNKLSAMHHPSSDLRGTMCKGIAGTDADYSINAVPSYEDSGGLRSGFHEKNSQVDPLFSER